MLGCLFISSFSVDMMLKYCQSPNSKCFLIGYLVLVGFLLTFWFNKVGLDYEELRPIPVELKPYLMSPPRDIAIDILDYSNELALTSFVTGNQWRLVYFSHAACFPACDKSWRILTQFRSAFHSQDVMTAVIDIDTNPKTQGELKSELLRRGYDMTVYDVDNEALMDHLGQRFTALFLRTDFKDGQYMIEQKHDLFLVDPKNRVYAVFKEGTPFEKVQSLFVAIRQFYAKTE